MKRALGTAAVLAGLLVPAAPASGATLLDTAVSIAGARERTCGVSSAGRGVTTRSVRVPASGWVSARLDGPARGDWDIALVDRRTKRLVAGGSSFGADEVASGLAFRGDVLSLKVCRRTGAAKRASVSVDAEAVDGSRVPKASLVRVSTPNPARKRELTGLGLDLTEHGGKNFVEVVLHGKADARKLREHKFVYRTEIADLAAQNRSDRAADSRYQARVAASSLPSRRDTYRRLSDYTNEMKALARRYPNLVKPITLRHKTFQGRAVEGIEITENVRARDGKPVFAQMGVHHAREWPSGEHAMEWAYELVDGYRRGGRARRLVQQTRTVIIPIVNPDGFNTSREAGGITNGRGGPSETANIVVAPPGEYRRKNCRAAAGTTMTACPVAFGFAALGVDPNRNYGGFWGGPGASEDPTAEDYRGEGPFSEPETKNIRELVSARQVTMLITNHTFSNLILRPPGIQAQGASPDEAGMKALGASMAAENGYSNQFGFQLYDTSGTTEDWTYWATGGYGYTFEIGPDHFHPPFADVVAEWEGTTDAADQGGRNGRGNREAYYKAQEATADTRAHSLIRGPGPSGGVLRLSKSFKTPTSPVLVGGEETAQRAFTDRLNTTMRVGDSGSFSWHINPSTRPLIAQSKGRNPRGNPSPPRTFTGLPGPPSDGTPPAASPCGDAQTTLDVCVNDHAFTVPTGPGIDNARAAVRIEWASPASDWDMFVYADTNGDGKSSNEVANGDAPLGSSTQGTTASEATTVGEPLLEPGKKYVIRVVNFAATEPYDGTITFLKPIPFVPGRGPESWTLTCEVPEGRVVSRTSLVIRRGQRQRVDLGRCVRRACVSRRRGIGGTRLGSAYLNRTRSRQRRRLGGRLLSRRGGIDRYCVIGGGQMRIGYPRGKYLRRVSRRTRRRIRSRAVLILTSSRRYSIKRIRRGTRTRTVRRRLRGERRVRIGRNTWYVAGGRRSRIVVKVRGGRVREIGIASKRLTRSRRGVRRLLASWRL